MNNSLMHFLILGIILLIGQIADGIATPFVGLQVGDAYSNQRKAYYNNIIS